MKLVWFASLVVLISSLLPPVIHDAEAQEDARRLVGVWEGEHNYPRVIKDSTRLEVFEEGGQIKWKIERKAQMQDGNQYWNSSGVVRLSPDGIELIGNFDDGSYYSVRGRPMKYFLNGGGDQLSGHLLGVSNTLFPVSFKRVGK